MEITEERFACRMTQGTDIRLGTAAINTVNRNISQLYTELAQAGGQLQGSFQGNAAGSCHRALLITERHLTSLQRILVGTTDIMTNMSEKAAEINTESKEQGGGYRNE